MATLLGTLLAEVAQSVWANSLHMQRRSWLRLLTSSASNLTQSILSLLLGVVTFRIVGGQIPTSTSAGPTGTEIIALFALLIVYSITSNVLLAAWLVINKQSVRDYLRRNWRALLLIEFGQLPVAGLLASIYRGPGAVVFAGTCVYLAAVLWIIYRMERSRLETAQHIRKLTTLSAISSAMRTSLDLPELFETIRQHIERLTDAPVFYVALYDANTSQVSFPFYSENGQYRHLRPSSVGNDLLGHVIRTRQSLLIRRDFSQAMARLNLDPPAQLPGSWLGVPMTMDDRVSGVMVIQSQKPGAYTPSDVDLLTTIAAQTAVALNNVQLYSALRQRATELAVLNSATTAIGATLDPERVLDVISLSIGPVTGCDKSAIFLLNENGNALQLARSQKLGAGYVDGARHVPVEPHGRGRVAAQRRPLVVVDIGNAFGLESFVPTAEAEGFHSLAEVPMIAQRDVVGTLAIYFADPHSFTQAELDVLQTFANQAAAALNNARLYKRTDQALARRVEELAALQEIGREFTGTLDVTRITESIVERAKQVTDAQMVALLLMDESGESGRFVAQRGYPPHLVESFLRRPWPANQGPVGPVILTGQIVNVPDVRLEPAYTVSDPNIRSFLVVPIAREGRVLGAITLGSYKPEAFDEATIAFTQQIANQASIALENARLFDERTQRVNVLSQLYQASLALTESLDLRQVLDRIVAVAHTLTHADTVSLHLYDPNTDRFQTGASAGIPMPGDGTASIRPQGMTRRVMQARQPIYVSDTQEEADTNEQLVVIGIRAMILVPLVSRDQVMGVLNVYSRQPYRFTESDVQLVSSLGNQAAAAIENARLFEAVAEARDKEKAILDSSREGILMFDLTGRVVMANPVLETMLGIQRDRVEGQLLTELLDRPNLDIASQLGYSPPAILAALDQLKRGEHLADTHDVYQLARPVERFVERSRLPVRDMSGRMIGWMITLRDVTEERELQQMRTDLTSMIVHDLRSPLSAIYSGILLLREMSPKYSSDDIVQDTFSAAERSCLRLVATVNSLLDISKVEAGRMKLEQQPTELREMVISVLDSLSPLAQEQDISLVGHVPEAWFVLVDEEKISRVLTNLVDNALKFTPPRGQISVTTEPAPGETDMILCSVHDDGPGIPMEYRDKIFDRFTQGPSQSGKRRGTGLGLAFCKMMVEAHGGRIWVESVNDQGSTFYFTLPLALPQPADQLWIESPMGPAAH